VWLLYSSAQCVACGGPYEAAHPLRLALQTHILLLIMEGEAEWEVVRVFVYMERGCTKA
jgi:hypothetical protein